MSTIFNISALFLFSTTFLLAPSIFFTLVLLKKSPRLDIISRLCLLWGFSAFLSPVVYFIASAITLEPITRMTSSVVSLGFTLLGLNRFRKEGVFRNQFSFRNSTVSIQDAIAISASICAFAFHLVNFDSSAAFDFSCLYRPCAIAAGTTGIPEFDGLNWNIFYDGHQRMGVTAILSPNLGWNGVLGIRWGWAIIMGSIPLSIYCLCARFGISSGSSAAASLLGTLLPCLLSTPDQNRLILALFAFLLVLITTPAGNIGILGFGCSVLLASEPASLLMFPGIIYLGFHQHTSSKISINVAFRFFAGFIFGSSIFLLRYVLAFDRFVLHEHFSYIPKIPYRVFNYNFFVSAYLGWPFREQLFRSPFNPTVNWILEPLIVIRHFGLALLFLIFLGLFRSSFVPGRRLRIVFFTSFLPFFLFLCINENWTQKDKWNIVVSAYAPLLMLIGSGLDELFKNLRNRKYSPLIASVFILASLSFFESFTLGQVYPEDRRFRESWSDVIEDLPPEGPEIISRELRMLGHVSVLPRPFSFSGFFSAYQHIPISAHSFYRDLQRPSILDRDFTLAEIPVILNAGPQSIEILPFGASRQSLSTSSGSFEKRRVFEFPPSIDGAILPEVPPEQIPTTCGSDIHSLRPFELPTEIPIGPSQRVVQVSLGIDSSKNYPVLVLSHSRSKIETGVQKYRRSTPVKCLSLELPTSNTVIVMNILAGDPLRTYWIASADYSRDRERLGSIYPSLLNDIEESFEISFK